MGESGEGRAHLMALPLQGDGKPLLVVEGASPSRAAISPDGQWVAYGSTFSGSPEVYVQAFPAQGAPQGRTQISIGGGYGPKWRGDGKCGFGTTARGLL